MRPQVQKRHLILFSAAVSKYGVGLIPERSVCLSEVDSLGEKDVNRTQAERIFGGLDGGGGFFTTMDEALRCKATLELVLFHIHNNYFVFISGWVGLLP